MEAATINVGLTSEELRFIINVLGETKSSTGAFLLMQKLYVALTANAAAEEALEATD